MRIATVGRGVAGVTAARAIVQEAPETSARSSPQSWVWFSLSHGAIGEVYYPNID
jgi:Glucodextranase, domain N